MRESTEELYEALWSGKVNLEGSEQKTKKFAEVFVGRGRLSSEMTDKGHSARRFGLREGYDFFQKKSL